MHVSWHLLAAVPPPLRPLPPTAAALPWVETPRPLARARAKPPPTSPAWFCREDGEDKPSARPPHGPPPPRWPPALEEPSLVLGDVVAVLVATSAAFDVSPRWLSEAGEMVGAWLVGAAATNAWDATATLPALGLGNAVRCVARASLDCASARLCVALAGGVAGGQPVDLSLVAEEWLLSTTTLAVWRAAYTSSKIYF
ncbi:hypothetical protein AB1Y20_002610 [Prymnesium parvum]|uniref:Uncharacterized protein n=1 Tax=Prymnesium parvum TaxID=97485 RepID=A0AB34J9K4_PRYPA